MRVEAAVFNGNDGLGHIRRQLVDTHCIAKERSTFGKYRSVGSQQHDAGFTLRNIEQALLVEIDEQIAGGGKHRDHGPQAQHHAP
jgi:hypothetical protein